MKNCIFLLYACFNFFFHIISRHYSFDNNKFEIEWKYIFLHNGELQLHKLLSPYYRIHKSYENTYCGNKISVQFVNTVIPYNRKKMQSKCIHDPIITFKSSFLRKSSFSLCIIHEIITYSKLLVFVLFFKVKW